jgi:hypothetical protein
MMTTLDHAVQEECRRILRRKRRSIIVACFLPRRRRRHKFHVFVSAVKMALRVNLISHYIVDIS